MKRTYWAFIPALLIIALHTPSPANTQSQPTTTPASRPALPRTRAETTGFVETGDYAEAVAFLDRLAATSPHARTQTFGFSGEGLALPLLILSRDGAFTPDAARRSSRPLVLIQNCIHAGECEGKDASLALARELLFDPARSGVLDRVNLLVLPIFNVDGHERRSPYSRINQVGPAEMGWRTTADNLNLNRDYIKADAIEMQAWLKLWGAWQPDLLIDCHTSDGEEQRYDLLYTFTDNADLAAPAAAWVREQFVPAVIPPLEKAGLQMLPYGWLRDRRDPNQGWQTCSAMPPRLSTGYVAACNRPSVLIETHARNPYGARVQATHAFLRQLLDAVAAQGPQLRAAVAAADREMAERRGAGDGRIPLKLDHTVQARRIVYRGYDEVVRKSDITGADVIEYQLDRPRDYDIPLYDTVTPTLAVAPRMGYLIPPQWRDVIARLKQHGFQMLQLQHECEIEVDSCRFEALKFEAPHEGRQMPQCRAIPLRERRKFVPGTVLVPTNQPRARLIAHMLEPEGPDALLAWGFFNAVLEMKEYGEAYMLEPLAQRMLAEDEALRAEFAERLKDETFAKDPHARLRFFHERSVFKDDRYAVYPIAAVGDAAAWTALLERAAPLNKE